MPIPDLAPTGRAHRRARRWARVATAAVVAVTAAAACSANRTSIDGAGTSATSADSPTTHQDAHAASSAAVTTSTAGAARTTVRTTSTTAPSATTSAPVPVKTIAGMPPVIDATNLYSEAGTGRLSPAVAAAKQYVYVPSNDAGTVTVIDQATYQVVRTFPTGGRLVQHVVPGYDMSTLYANVSGSNFLREIDPTTGEAGGKIPVDAPYNLYWTPDGTRAIVMAERLNRIDFYDRATWKPMERVTVPCKSRMKGFNFGGVNHADWSIDGRYFLATCEFAGDMIKVDTATMEVIGQVHLKDGAMPQDVRITPDGKKFYVADMLNGGVWILDGDSMTVTGHIDTGKGAHGLYPSRDGSVFYVANRGRLMGDTSRRSVDGEGSVSVIDWRTDKVTVTWPIPGGGSPDMGGVSADGSTLWLSGRYDSEVYAIDTSNGALRARIRVAHEPHGLAVFPQPGRYSLGHTGNTR